MIQKEIRPYPVPAEVLMRSTLFAFAQLGAQLQAYNEETGVIVATVPKRMGLQKQDVIVRVRPFEGIAQLELETANSALIEELVRLISAYVQDGGKLEANARIQWTDLAREQANRVRRQGWVNKVKSFVPGATPSPMPASVAPESESGETIVSETGSALVPIPDNPGVLVKNEQAKMIELKIDPQTFTDRSAHLQICTACNAAIMRESLYCSNCGRPLTLAAVQPELQQGVEGTSARSLRMALGGLACNVVPLLVLVMPALFRDPDLSFMNRVEAGLSTPIVVTAFILGILPMILFGWQAISLAQRASWFYSLGGTPDTARRTRGILGNALGWFCIYLAIAWALFVVIALF